MPRICSVVKTESEDGDLPNEPVVWSTIKTGDTDLPNESVIHVYPIIKHVKTESLDPHNEHGISSTVKTESVDFQTEHEISPIKTEGVGFHTEREISPIIKTESVDFHTEREISPIIKTESVDFHTEREISSIIKTEGVDFHTEREISPIIKTEGVDFHTEREISPIIKTERVDLHNEHEISSIIKTERVDLHTEHEISSSFKTEPVDFDNEREITSIIKTEGVDFHTEHEISSTIKTEGVPQRDETQSCFLYTDSQPGVCFVKTEIVDLSHEPQRLAITETGTLDVSHSPRRIPSFADMSVCVIDSNTFIEPSDMSVCVTDRNTSVQPSDMSVCVTDRNTSVQPSDMSVCVTDRNTSVEPSDMSVCVTDRNTSVEPSDIHVGDTGSLRVTGLYVNVSESQGGSSPDPPRPVHPGICAGNSGATVNQTAEDISGEPFSAAQDKAGAPKSTEVRDVSGRKMRSQVPKPHGHQARPLSEVSPRSRVRKRKRKPPGMSMAEAKVHAKKIRAEYSKVPGQRGSGDEPEGSASPDARITSRCRRSKIRAKTIAGYTSVASPGQSDGREAPLALTCDLCGGRFVTYWSLEAHTRLMHRLPQQSAQDKLLPTCQVCKKVFPSDYTLSVHEKIHSLPGYLCIPGVTPVTDMTDAEVHPAVLKADYAHKSTSRKPRYHFQRYMEDIVSKYSDIEFRRMFRLSRSTFIALTKMLQGCPELTFGRALPTDVQLYITLWYLGGNDRVIEVAKRFRVSESAVVLSRQRVIDGILNNLKSKCISWPENQALQETVEKFETRNGFPDIVGALDATHIAIKAPEDNQRSYVNRYKYHSLLLQAVCNSDMLFLDCFAGFPGRCHDSTVLKHSALWRNGLRLCNGNHLVADGGYPLRRWLLTPFRHDGHLTRQEKNFNDLLSSNRVVIERAFALLRGRFRRLLHIDTQSVQTAAEIITAACVLHNICLLQDDNIEDFLDIGNRPDPAPKHNVRRAQENEAEGIAKRNLLAVSRLILLIPS